MPAGLNSSFRALGGGRVKSAPITASPFPPPDPPPPALSHHSLTPPRDSSRPRCSGRRCPQFTLSYWEICPSWKPGTWPMWRSSCHRYAGQTYYPDLYSYSSTACVSLIHCPPPVMLSLATLSQSVADQPLPPLLAPRCSSAPATHRFWCRWRRQHDRAFSQCQRGSSSLWLL